MNKVIATAVFSVIAGGLVAGLAVAVYFLQISNDDLQNRMNELTLQKSTLIGEVEKAEAEQSRLKKEALENNVFLGNP
jgi:hypothetical protein